MEKGTGLLQKLKSAGQQVAGRLPGNVDSLPALLSAGQGLILRQKLDRYGTLATILLSTYFLGDVTAFIAQDYLLKEPVVPKTMFGSGDTSRRQTIDDLGAIFSRNLFNSRGIIPGESPGKIGEGPPIKTTLPLNLIGTVILEDELKSLATLEDRSAQMVYPVRVADEIPSKIRVTKVEARRVTFINLGSGRNEYVEMPEELFLVNPIITVKSSLPKTGGVEQVSEGKYSVARREIDAALADLPKVLTQARAVPNWENGVFTCYKLFQIAQNSIYDKLGLKNGDCLSEIDGEAILDPGKAFEKLQQLKDKNHVDLKIKRNGKDQGLAYDIN